MSSSNTRHALAPWENRLVVCDGILKSVKRKPDGSAHLLLVNCRVRAFDPDVRLSDQPFVKVDHIWDEVNDPEATPTGLLIRQSCAGIVRQYARADGTVDWEVRGIDAQRLDNTLHLMHQRLETGWVQDRRAYRREMYRGILANAAAGVPVYSMNEPTAEVLQWVRRELDIIEAQIQREALAPSHGPCNKFRETLRLRGSQRQQTRGFA